MARRSKNLVVRIGGNADLFQTWNHDLPQVVPPGIDHKRVTYCLHGRDERLANVDLTQVLGDLLV